MAISVRASGTWSVATTQSPTVTIPSGYQDGDLGILVSVWRPYSVTATVNQSWNEIIDVAAGSTANGTGVGSSRLYVAYKVLGSSETNPTLTRSGAITPGGQVIVVLQKGSADGPWDVASLSAAVEQAMSTTAMSHVATTSAAIIADDLIFALTGVADDSATFTRASSAISGGPSWGANVVEYPATHASSTSGNDMAADLIYRAASSGVASGQSITITATLSAAERVGSVLFRVRAPRLIALDLLDAGPTLYAPTVTAPPQSVTLPLLDALGGGYAAEVLADSPTFVLPMDESSGTITDIVGSKTATIYGTPTYGVTGPVTGHTAITFTRTGNYLTFADHADLDLGTGALSVEMWIKTNDGNSAWLLNKGTETPSLYYGPTLRFSSKAYANAVYSSVAVNDNAWHHIVGTHDASDNWKLYVDGSDVTVVDSTPPTADTSDALSIPDSDFTGTIAYVALYKGSALSSTRIAAHFNAASTSAVGLYAPTVTRLNYLSVSLGLLDAGATLYAPTLTPKNAISLGLLDAGAAVYAPTLATRNTLTLGLLDAGAALYAPGLAPQPVAVTVPFLDAGAALYAPTLLPKNTLTLGLIDAGAALYQPTLTPKNTLTVPFLDAGAALYAPGLAPQPVTISLGLLDAGAALYAPSASVGPVTVTLPLLDAGAELYAPSSSQAGGAPQSLTVPFLDAGAALYQPTLLPQPVTISLGLLDAGAALYAPGIAVSQPLTIPQLDAGNALYAPALAVGPVGITLGLLDGAPALYAPAVVPKWQVTLGLLDASPALYQPTLTPKWQVTLGLLDAGAALYAPAILPGAVGITVPLLDGSPSLYAPTLEIILWQQLVLGTIDGGAEVYPPSVANVSALLSGYTRDRNGAIVPNAVVDAFVSASNVLYASTTSDIYGLYSILVTPGVEYFLVAYELGADIYGVTERDLVGS